MKNSQKSKIIIIIIIIAIIDKTQQNSRCRLRGDRDETINHIISEWYMKVMIILFIIGALCTVTKGLVQRLEDLEITGRVETINYSIVEIGQNTEKSSGDLRRLVVTQTPAENNQLTLM